MKLSEAIIQGAQRHHQSFGAMLSGGKTDIFGCVYEITFGTPSGTNYYWEQLIPKYPLLASRRLRQCPVEGCDMQRKKFASVLFHLNDFHRWSREKIAVEYVQLIEREVGLLNYSDDQFR